MHRSITKLTTGRWRTFPEYWQRHIKEYLTLDWSSFRDRLDLKDTNPYMLLAQHEGRFIGWGAFFPFQEVRFGMGFHRVYQPEAHFFVDPEFRRQGVGRFLGEKLAHYIKRYRKGCAFYVTGWDTTSNAFFGRLIPALRKSNCNVDYFSTGGSV